MKGRKSLVIAFAVMLVAAGSMTAVYMYKQNNTKQEQLQAAKDSEKALAKKEENQKDKKDTKKDTEKMAAVDSMLKPKPAAEPEADKAEKEESGEPAAPTANKPAVQQAALHFSEESELNWPLQGNVILNYSMDQTTYFATLDQYKYNPAVVIAGAVNDKISCAATGKITDISANELTGTTVTMDLGDGYSAIYGQLKQVSGEVGDTIEQGNLVGYIAEPTKYYSVEGSNLYFALQKDGSPVDPVTYFE